MQLKKRRHSLLLYRWVFLSDSFLATAHQIIIYIFIYQSGQALTSSVVDSTRRTWITN